MPPFQLGKVDRVEFYRRDGDPSGPICCDITTRAQAIFAHENMPHWDELIRKLEFLGGFDVEWFLQLGQHADAGHKYAAFQRHARAIDRP